MVASVRGREFVPAVRVLEAWGPVRRTDYYNVLVLRVADPRGFLAELTARVEAEPWMREVLAHVRPALATFDFGSREEFEERAREAARTWLADLEGRAFHVRMHRRGFRRQLSSQGEERALCEALLAELERRGRSGRVTFEDPDAVVAVETVGGRAGVSLWTRADRERFPLLGVD